MIKAVFFDVANTLLHKPKLYTNIQQALNKNGYAISIANVKSVHQQLSEEIIFPDKTDKKFYEEFNKKLCAELEVEPSDYMIQSIYQSCKGLSWGSFDDINTIGEIDLLKGIASNWDYSLRDKLKELIPFDFNWVLGSEELGFKKPDPLFFHEMIKVSGCDPDKIMFVGDSMRLDITPAKLVGIDAVLIDRTGFYSSYEGKKISNMKELLSLI